ncbi:MAG: tRNA (adenosine(37)-N6)-threonylcarbamoyltransferase complex ATPase subunit type 1 TsaE [Pontiellaceae bacterium]|mgnify:FL=1|nr:tRNA (adenosine(37)-N6)-threonylcarbamoyltransferase complex ATPase subunit type 1 TsaE [Kiritimatiellaceae bacterium]HBO87322.1 tRNA (adenosine(37)-N6)-threonylcarbamoyltransferase complex ATPase subunit type 1 TsaE [Verrucomicrobiota bacterium]
MKQIITQIKSEGPEQTWAAAATLMESLEPGTVIALHGELGAGKTCFIQGLAAAMGITDPITSPTYTLIGEYEGRMKLNHIDLYRLANSVEALGIGLEEYLESDGITAIEWAERAEEILPESMLHVSIEKGRDEMYRQIEIWREVVCES